tara:strand:- start:886 stop:2076 length:1191 start_codon:yes stop_codon:yes gene_type:complete
MRYFIVFIIILLILPFSCQKSDESENVTPQNNQTNQSTESSSNTNNTESTNDTQSSNDNSFDRIKMMTDIAEHIIIPSFENLDKSLEELKEAFELFKINVTDHNLENLRNKWLNSYKLWQHVEMFNIGKAMGDYYLYKSNIYPVDTTRVKQNIDSGNYDLNNPNNYAAQGFPTIDYMLYGLNTDNNKVINHLRDNSKNMDYLGVLINTLAEITKSIKEDWYQEKDKFVQSIENSASSNLNMMVNDFIYYYEKGFRANKFGIPAGVFSGSSLPDRVEGYYSKNFSKVFALEAMNSIKKFFNGKSYVSSEVSIQSLKSYLDYVESGKEKLLSNDINSQLTIAENSINELDNNFSSQISSNLTKVLRTYDDIQTAVVLLKVDMLQVLNIPVDYVDADGD